MKALRGQGGYGGLREALRGENSKCEAIEVRRFTSSVDHSLAVSILTATNVAQAV